MLPAGNAQKVDEMTFLEHQVKKRLVEFDMQGKATRAYESGDLANALVYYELLQDFERTDAIWNGKSDEYFKRSSETVNILFDMPLKIIAQPDGAQILQTNLEEMGPIITHGVRLPILIALSNYYSFKQVPEMAAKYASAALPYLKLGEQDQPNPLGCRAPCNLAYSSCFKETSMLLRRRLRLCLRSAKKLGDPWHLVFAHQVNVFVLQGGGQTKRSTGV
jgi:hypothetical protein